jgi:hypothetical protein
MTNVLPLASPQLLLSLILLTASEFKRPNIIVSELGCDGGKDVPTPNLNAMAKAGARFTSGDATCEWKSANAIGSNPGFKP